MSLKPRNLQKNATIIVLFLVTLFNISYNLPNFPTFFWDQGVYIERAINFIQNSVVYDDPTYIDHPPLGWIIPSLIFKVIGFPGSVIHTQSLSSTSMEQQIILLFLIPRLIAIIFTMIIASLVYKIASVMYGDRNLAIVSLASFSLMPAMWPFRNMLVDPIMITFVLLSLFLFISENTKFGKSQIIHRKKFWITFFLSSLLFGIAILVKLTAIFFLPAVLLFASRYGRLIINKSVQTTLAHSVSGTYLQTTTRQKAGFAILWTIPVIVCLASWIIFLASQNELSSLMTTQLWQISRPSLSLPAFALPLLLMASPIGTVFGIFGLAMMILNKQKRIWAFLGIPYLAFLFRGGYIGWVHTIPMLPLLSIYAAKPLFQLAETAICRFERNKNKTADPTKIARYLVVSVFVVSIAVTIWLASFSEARSDEETIQYLVSNIPKKASLVTDPGYGWLIKIYRPDLNVIDYYLLEKMGAIPSSFYIAEKSNPSKYDPALSGLDNLYYKSCLVKNFENDPSNNFFHPYSLAKNKWWNVEIRYFDVKGCTNS